MKGPVRFLLNDAEVETSLQPGTRLLDYLRRHRRLRGTREGCREGECGACTVLAGCAEGGVMRYRTAASCLLPLAQVDGTHVITVEGLGPGLSPVQKALCDHHAIQCGFCTPGIVMSLTGFFCSSPSLSEQDALDSLDGNICRCTGYASIRRAASALCAPFGPRLDPARDRCAQLVEWGILPACCASAAARLEALPRGTARRGAAALLVGGATDLLVQQADQVENAESLRLASEVAGADGIRVSGSDLVIGGAATIEELRRSPELQHALPSLSRTLAEDLKLVASTPLRNRATVAGNLVNASPIGDLSIILLALDARLTIASGRRRRELPLRRFFRGYRDVDLAAGEAVEAIAVRVRDLRLRFEKVSRRRVLDIASVNVALCADGESVGLAAGGVAPVPLYLEAASRLLSGGTGDAAEARAAIDLALGEIAPISDVRGSAAYKRLLLRNLLIAALSALFPQRVDAAALLEATR